MADFRFHIGAECYVGPETIFKLPLILEGGPERLFLVADPNLREKGVLARITTIIEGRGIQIITFDDLGDKPSAQAVAEAVVLARGARAPLVLGIGGIRALHVAKAVAALVPGQDPVERWMDGEAPTCHSLPLILIPTTWRDPFLLSGELVLGDARTGRAVHLQARRGIESAVILDPGLMEGLSPKTSAACILDGIMAAVEGFASTRENFLSDIALREGIALYIRALDILMQRPDDPQSRIDGTRACFLTSMGLASSSAGLGTAVSFAINARWGVPKANVSAVVLPYLLETISRSRLEKIAQLAPIFGEASSDETSGAAADRVVEGIRTRLGMLKIPSRLKDFDMSLERLVETAESARKFGFMSFLPRSMTVDDVFDFIKTVY